VCVCVRVRVRVCVCVCVAKVSDNYIEAMEVDEGLRYEKLLQCIKECCDVLQHLAERCSVLQCVAVCCSVLQSPRTRCAQVCRSLLIETDFL